MGYRVTVRRVELGIDDTDVCTAESHVEAVRIARQAVADVFAMSWNSNAFTVTATVAPIEESR